MEQKTTALVEVKDARSARLAIAEYDLRQRDIAARMGTPDSHLSCVLHGKERASRRYFLRLSFALSEAAAERERERAATRPAPTPRIRRV